MLIDSHCHLNYLDDPYGAFLAAKQRGIDQVLCIGVEQATIHEVLDLARLHQGIWATVGEHPDSVSADGQPPDWVEQYLSHEGVVAVGETGLDYLHAVDPSLMAKQRDTFAAHLSIAQSHRLPVVVHTRNACADTIDLIKAHTGVEGVLHCFTESWEMAKQALDLGFYISISGIVTFKNADNVREVAQRIPDDRLLVETDAPWLTPVPNRGKTNEPAFVRATAEFVATLRGVSFEEFAATTTANCKRLFSI